MTVISKIDYYLNEMASHKHQWEKDIEKEGFFKCKTCERIGKLTKTGKIRAVPVKKNKTRITKSKAYIGVKPGTKKWMKLWKEHPEWQEEMLKYRKSVA